MGKEAILWLRKEMRSCIMEISMLLGEERVCVGG